MPLAAVPARLPSVVVRELPPEDYPRLADAHGPLHGVAIRAQPGVRVMVGEADGQIVAYWPIFTAVHAEPLFIDEAYRKHPHLLRQLLSMLTYVMREDHIETVFAVICDLDEQDVRPLAERAGFGKVPGSLYATGLRDLRQEPQ